MKVLTRKYLLAFIYICLIFGSKGATTITQVFDRWEHEQFAFGADVSFVPNMEANKTRLEKAMAPVQIPNLSCTPSSGLAIYQDEIFTVYFIRPDNYDVERFEYYFDQFGYALNKKFDKSYLTSHSNFNYIQVNNIDIINSHSMLLREIGKKQLMNGVRIWHRLPNKNKSYE